MIPMNQDLANQTIEDHKYLLELVDNRAAIAFFAATNRNQALYEALVEYYKAPEGEDQNAWREENKQPKGQTTMDKMMCEQFYKIIDLFDFMSLVMYPDLNNRREFVHDYWTIAQSYDNSEFKMEITKDPFFYLNRDDLLIILRKEETEMINHLIDTKCKLHITEDIGYQLIAIKNEQVDKNQHTRI